jgi:hypothetical protein
LLFFARWSCPGEREAYYSYVPDKIIFPDEQVLRSRELVSRELKLLRDLKSRRAPKRFPGKPAGPIVLRGPHLLDPFAKVA